MILIKADSVANLLVCRVSSVPFHLSYCISHSSLLEEEYFFYPHILQFIKLNKADIFYALYGVFYNNFRLNLYTAIKLEDLQKVNEASEKEVSVVREELHNVKK